MATFDFSTTNELKLLSEVVGDLAPILETHDIRFMVIGATARDLLLRHGYGIQIDRGTEDVDFAVMIDHWDHYETLRSALIKAGNFSARSKTAHHRLRHRTDLPLDLVPFGKIERPDRTIVWPPDHAVVFDCFGVAEAFAASLEVTLPGDRLILVPRIAALALLKIAAWYDRQRDSDNRDAQDLALYMQKYLDCGNFDHAAANHPDIFEDDDYDHEIAGARLLGRDIAELLDAQGIDRCLKVLLPEADADARMLLARQSGVALERACALIQATCDGLAELPARGS